MSEPYGRLDTGQQFRIKLDALIDSRLLIQANSGGGKSYAVRKLLELTHGGVQQIVIDPEGEFATLREKFDYVYAAAKDGDALAHPRTAKLLAERLLETGVSAIVDIYELKQHERTTFVKLFLDAMVNAPKHLWHPCLVVLDEAHVYAPETDKSEAHGAVADIATRGRKRGFCLVAATQRISKLSKDVAAELNNKLLGRAALDVDVKRAAAELGISYAEALKQLRHLDAGQFYGWGPATNVNAPTLMKVGEVVTRHPKRGERAMAAPKPTKAILEVLPKLSDLPKEAEQELRTADDLRKELAKVRRDLTLAQKPAPAGHSKAELNAEYTRGREEGFEAGAMAAATSFEKRITTAADAYAETRRAYEHLGTVIEHVRKYAEVTRTVQTNGARTENQVRSGHNSQRVAPVTRPAPRALQIDARAPSDGVTRPQQKILDAIAWLNDKGIDPPHKNTVAAVAGVSPTSGGYFNNLGAMKSAGLIDYPQPGFVALTIHGESCAISPQAGGELHEKWLEIVTEPQRKILRALIEVHPEILPKDDLATRIGVSPTSGGYFNNLGALKTIGAIDYPQKGFACLSKYVMP